jgi:hypothetical protein
MRPTFASYSPLAVSEMDASPEEASKSVQSHKPFVLASLIETSNRLVASNAAVNWRVAAYDQLRLITECHWRSENPVNSGSLKTGYGATIFSSPT